MPLFRSAWLLPISQPPIRDAWLRTERGRVVAFGRARPGNLASADEINLGVVAVLPGLINAHTHLELSWMRGRVPETDDFPSWIRSVISLQRRCEATGREITSAIDAAIAEARRFGTVAIGDISNTLASSSLLAERGLSAVVFRELIGFESERAPSLIAEAVSELGAVTGTDRVSHSLAAHAPYSVSPQLFSLIRSALQKTPEAPSSVHLGESRAELQFLRDGTGPWRSLLEDLGAWDPAWVAPNCDPVEFLDRLGFIEERLLVVHGVHFGQTQLTRLRERGATIVTCPRGNLRTGAGTPPVDGFYASANRVAVGTDSLASVPDLNIFAELAALRSLAPRVSAAALLESATVHGAHALGFQRLLGTVERGKSDRLIAIEVDTARSDVQEQLVSGITEEQISWLPES
jgi:cytosine/adenosine deaminase-related metal-dependent hydrolase